MNITVNKQKFEIMLGYKNLASEYRFALTKCCGSICIFDEFLNELYFNKIDPSRHAALDFPQCCPICKTKDWDLDIIEIFNDSEVGDWIKFV